MDAAAGKPSELPAAFTVRGTHQTSKQPIVFTGRIASGPSDHAVPRTVSQTAMPSDILLSGQAKVGATTLIPIQATSTAR